jgi:hypothetical protein
MIMMKLWLPIGWWRLLMAGEVRSLPVLLLMRAGLVFSLKIAFILLTKGLFILTVGPISLYAYVKWHLGNYDDY